jgi:PAS domain S-box-containing protein
MHEKRRPVPETALGYLEHLPALVLIDRLPIPIVALDAVGDVIHANPAFEELLGYDPGTLVGRPLQHLLFEPSDHQSPHAILMGHRGRPIALLHREGTPVQVVASDSVFLRRDDPLTLVSLHDITETLWTGGQTMTYPATRLSAVRASRFD